MPLFIYEAVDLKGNKYKDYLEKDNAAQVAEYLKNSGLMVINIKKQSVLNADIRDVGILSGGTDKKELSLFCRQLSFILDTGVDISRAFQILISQTKNQNYKKAYTKVHGMIMKGESLSACMEKNVILFPSILSGMVKAGELSGNLGSVMQRMAEYYEKEHRMSEEIKSAMIYPVIVTLMMLTVIIMVVVYVVPNYSYVFMSEGVELPAPTKALVSAGYFITENYIGIAFFAVLFGISVFAGLRTGRGMFLVDWCKLNVKILNTAYLKALNLRFSQTLELLLGSGIQMVASIEITKSVINNKIIDKALNHIAKSLEEGATLASLVANSGYFEPLLCGMIQVGEETGKLPETLAKCSEYFQSEYDRIISRLNKLIEPAITIVLGLVLAYVMLAVMLPTFSLTDII